MAVFKCKMCGASLEIAEGMTVAECAYCGTEQTLPKLNDNKANLYDRANHFRRNNDYDKAMSIYERILNEDTKDAEAYWSLVLCRYGIEYVEDPLTHKRVPTVNRTQHTSVFADEDYKSAIKYADVVQRRVYENEARAIDKIQKGILAISQKEKPFDVFICYKETGADGRRTRDSVLANDLYHQLTQEGFKVFFSRITLEDKLGTAYEPYIFSALNSAKVMVVLGTKPEYFNAVWVKNEWSRYLALIRKGEKKVLIPAYRDMDPYDLPDEFSHLQAQDMSKLGFMQDLIRGIKKLTNKQAEKPVIKEVVREVKTETTANTNTAPLLRRGYMFLEDKDWKRADEYFEKVLDLEPENGKAYLGKLLATLKCSKLEDVEYCDEDFSNDKNYKRVLCYGDSKTIKELQYYKDYSLASVRQEIEPYKNLISAGGDHTVGLKKDGTVLAVGYNNHRQCDVSKWKDIVAISAGYDHTVGLKKDGTVVAVGYNYKDDTVVAVGYNYYGQCDVSKWKDIVAISAGYDHTVGLKKDGTVVAVGSIAFGQCDVSDWKDIVAISAGGYHTVGLKKDGTVVAVGYNKDGQCDVSGWKDIVAISAGGYHTVGLKKDGTVLDVGRNAFGQYDDVSKWKDIVAISASFSHTVGLKKDGTVLAVGSNAFGQCNVLDLKDILPHKINS